MNQGYAYKVATKLAGLEQDTELLYETREQQVVATRKSNMSKLSNSNTIYWEFIIV